MVRSRTSCWPRARSACGESDVRLRGLEVGAGLVERVLERPLVDGEQEVALLHDLAVGEVDLVEIARYARAHLDHVDRDEAADIFVLIDDGALDRLGDRHLGRRRCCLLLALAATGKEGRKGDQRGSQDSGGCRHEVGPKVVTNAGIYEAGGPAADSGRALVNGERTLPSPQRRTPYLWANPKSTSHLRTVPGHAGIAKGAPGTLHARPTHARSCQPAPRPAG